MHGEGGRGLRGAGLAVTIMYAGLALQTVVMSRVGQVPALTPLRRFDARWYQQIVVDGYDRGQGSGLSNLAFFPLFPALGRLVHQGLGLAPDHALIVVAWLAAGLAAVGLYRLGEMMHGPAAGLWLVALAVAAPRAGVLGMGYAESLLLALCVWSLVLTLQGRLWWAAGLCCLAGLTKLASVSLVAALGLVWLGELLRWRRSAARGAGPGAEGGVLRRLGWGPLAVLGLGLSLGLVMVRTGSPEGYVGVQEQWGLHRSLPWDALSQAAHASVGPGWMARNNLLVLVWIGVFALLLVWCLIDRVPAPVIVFALALLVVTVTATGYPHSRARFLVPGLVVLLPVAARLGRARRWGLLAVPLVVALAVADAWWAGYTMLVVGLSP